MLLQTPSLNRMQIEDATSPTYSINSNALKLNSSSVVLSTPGCQNGQGPLVFFEEFAQSNAQRNSLKGVFPKKRLTIQIDQNYEFEQHTQQTASENLPKNKHEESAIQAPKLEYQQAKMQQFVNQLRSQAQQLQHWKTSYQVLQKEKERLRIELISAQQTLRLKEDALILQQQKNQEMALRVGQLQEVAIQDKFYDEKLREKESKYRELQKIHEKVVAMNKSLRKDLGESDKKIMELEKEIQKTVCSTQYENLAKIKESSSKMKESSLKVLNPLTAKEKENAQANVVKSVDKKKISASQVKKTGKITSSTTNFSRKAQTKNGLV